MVIAKTFLAWTVVPSLAYAALTVDSNAGRNIMEQSRRLDQNNNVDYSFVGNFKLKFQGCHHVQQWNDNVDEENDVKIKTKRLVRFRLCPADQCSDEKLAGCTSKYGDYVVDMNTFVANYFEALQNQKESDCEYGREVCENRCDNDEDCEEECYDELSMAYCLEDEDAQENGFQVNNYLECAEAPFQSNNGYAYYIGPFCAQQGGQVQLGLFSDDTCTTHVEDGDDTFYENMGYQLPYGDDTLISLNCLDCGQTNENGYTETSETCSNLYTFSGKCETRMSVDYPNESSCDYIEGIKIIREDGVIRTSSVRKSKAAAVAIGMFMTLSILMAGYVFYLRTKLSRAQINLAASSAPLT
uniref:Uncharacterized protein n=1 Tax=Amphora coffeiformis TaxID=265554 RepID=A0A7S3PA54_9STRA